MALETIDRAPQVGHYTLLSQHQEQTPGTFYGAKPILHLHSPAAQIKISQEDLESQPTFAGLKDETDTTDDEGQSIISNVDVWIASDYTIIYSNGRSFGIKIAYPTITVHAQEGNAVLLGLNLSDSNTADEDLVFVQLRIIPQTMEAFPQSEADQEPEYLNGYAELAPSQALFKAISDCQELNPDPPEDGEDGIDDQTAPGASGWITSENMQEFLDENGELKMAEGMTVVGAEDDAGGSLGEGAGRTRTAAEVEDGDGEADESKWQRTG